MTMNLNSLALNSFLAVAFVVVPVVSMAAPKSGAPERDGILELLRGFQNRADDASLHAAELQSTARAANPSWHAHAYKLELLKTDINEMGRCLVDLEKARDSATTWEKKAIDEARPILTQMADNTQSAVRYLNDNGNRLFAPAYAKYIDNLASESEQLSNSVGHFLQFAKVQRKEDRLERTLGISGGSF